MSDFDIIPRTCNATEKPPNPSKKEDIRSFNFMLPAEIIATFLTPFVSSTIPLKNDGSKL